MDDSQYPKWEPFSALECLLLPGIDMPDMLTYEIIRLIENGENDKAIQLIIDHLIKTGKSFRYERNKRESSNTTPSSNS